MDQVGGGVIGVSHNFPDYKSDNDPMWYKNNALILAQTKTEFVRQPVAKIT